MLLSLDEEKRKEVVRDIMRNPPPGFNRLGCELYNLCDTHGIESYEELVTHLLTSELSRYSAVLEEHTRRLEQSAKEAIWLLLGTTGDYKVVSVEECAGVFFFLGFSKSQYDALRRHFKDTVTLQPYDKMKSAVKKFCPETVGFSGNGRSGGRVYQRGIACSMERFHSSSVRSNKEIYTYQDWR